MLVSFAKTVRSSAVERIDFDNIITMMRTDVLIQKKILHLRSLNREDELRRYKSSELPYFTFGEFRNNIRSDVNLLKIKFIIIDIDNLTTEQTVKFKTTLKDDEGVFCAFISPSGLGIKIIYELDTELTEKTKYNRLYKAFLDWFREKYGVEPDEKTSDPSRPCFVSHDPDLILHEQHELVSVTGCLEYWENKYGKKESAPPASNPRQKDTLPSQSQRFPNSIDMHALLLAVDFLIKKNNEMSGIYDSYNTWQVLGLSLAAIGEQGREPFIRLSLGNTKFHDSETDLHNEFNKLIKYYGLNPNPVRINTLFHIAKQHGWQSPHSVNENDSPVYDGSDVDNAEIFIRHHLNEIRAFHNFGSDDKHNTFFRWFLWDGKRWKTDSKAAIFDLIRKTIKRLKKDALKCQDRKLADRMDDASNGLKKLHKQRALLYQVSTDVRITLENKEIDSDPDLFNVLNGTLDFSGHEIVFRNHDRQDNITKISNVTYDADASCPQWLAFLDKVCSSNKDVILFLQKAVGLSLTGDISQQCVFFIYGSGGNGKSVFFKVLMYIFGNYAQKAPASMLTQQRFLPIPIDIARLKGRRFVVASELDEGAAFDEARLKDLTGGDVLVARLMRQDFFEFEPVHKLWLFGNHRPTIHGTDEGIWRRMKLIPFTAVISPQERIPMNILVATLKAEASGILNWAIAGLIDYRKYGLGSPQIIQEATDEYKKDSNSIGRFIDDCCVLGSSHSCLAKDLYKSFIKWSQDNGELIISQKKFHAKLRDAGYISVIGTANKTFWRNIGIKADAHII